MDKYLVCKVSTEILLKNLREGCTIYEGSDEEVLAMYDTEDEAINEAKKYKTEIVKLGKTARVKEVYVELCEDVDAEDMNDIDDVRSSTGSTDLVYVSPMEISVKDERTLEVIEVFSSYKEAKECMDSLNESPEASDEDIAYLSF
jgi:hypothetical protein